MDQLDSKEQHLSVDNMYLAGFSHFRLDDTVQRNGVDVMGNDSGES
jgi:hypothetical protein